MPHSRWPLVLCLGLTAVVRAPARAQAPVASVVSLDSLLDAPISTAAKYSQRVSEVAGSVTIVSSEDIERYGYRTLDQVLATVPGFYVSDDRNYTYIGARGFSRPTDYNNRILLLVDGNAVNESVFGAAPLGSELAIPLSSLERIEIVRGPGSALYGTGAVFGVINLITRSAAAIDGGRISLSGGSFGQRSVSGLFGRRLGARTELMLGGLWDRSAGQDLFYPEYNSPATHAGIAHNLDGERLWGVLGSLTHGNFRLHGRYGARRKAIPTGAYGMLFNANGAYTWDAYSFLELNYDRDLGADKHLSTRAFYNHYGYDGDYPYADSLAGVAVTTEGSDNEILGGEATFRWDLGSANRLTLGGEVRRNVEARYYTPRSTPRDIDLNGPSTVSSGYLQDEHQFSKSVSLLAGLRYDASTITPNSLTPRLALLIRPTGGATFKLLYGEAFRAPSVYEAVIGGLSYLQNPALVPERIRTLEAIWQQRIGTGALWSTSVFNYRMRNLIDLTVDSATSLYQYRNVGTARSTGFETGVEARVGASVRGFANYTYQLTVDGSTGDRLTNSPAHLLKGGLSGSMAGGFKPGIVMRYESPRKTVYGTSTGAYFLVDLNLRLDRPLGASSGRLGLGLRVSNLFDTRYATPGGVEHLQPAITQNGRNVSLELRYGF